MGKPVIKCKVVVRDYYKHNITCKFNMIIIITN